MPKIIGKQIFNSAGVWQLIKNLKQARRLMKTAGVELHFLLDTHSAPATRILKEQYLHKKSRGVLWQMSCVVAQANK